jgi:hypothetical protein
MASLDDSDMSALEGYSTIGDNSSDDGEEEDETPVAGPAAPLSSWFRTGRVRVDEDEDADEPNTSQDERDERAMWQALRDKTAKYMAEHRYDTEPVIHLQAVVTRAATAAAAPLPWRVPCEPLSRTSALGRLVVMVERAIRQHAPFKVKSMEVVEVRLSPTEPPISPSDARFLEKVGLVDASTPATVYAQIRPWEDEESS